MRQELNFMIETKRLILRLMNKNDINKMLKIFNDENVMKSFNIKSFSREQMKHWIDRNLNHQKKYGYGLFSVILKSNNELIGDCGLEHSIFERKPENAKLSLSRITVCNFFINTYNNVRYSEHIINKAII